MRSLMKLRSRPQTLSKYVKYFLITGKGYDSV